MMQSRRSFISISGQASYHKLVRTIVMGQLQHPRDYGCFKDPSAYLMQRFCPTLRSAIVDGSNSSTVRFVGC